MGRMETIWGDPLVFRPERFLEENLGLNIFATVPFSAGSRNCLGQKYAMLEIKNVISKFLRNFEIEVAPNYEPELTADVVLRPNNGMMLKIFKRTS